MVRNPAPARRNVSRARGRRGGGARRWALWLGRIAGGLFLVWLAGLAWFALTLPGPAPLTTRTDGVVVLTGGSGRLARGLEVLEADAAKHMLVSGVARGTSRRMLARAAGIPVARLDTTELGYEAIDTRSNAEETARWVARNKYRSIRLVTSERHMRRARLELAQTIPASVAVISDSVPVEPGQPGIIREYSKYLVRLVAQTTGLA
jgi:uncharacterized SAM-binding protein YcdF (DUF218 family)